MRVCYDLHQTEQYERIVLAMGNFDGVHIGHQRLLQEVIRQAKAMEAIPAVLIFNPHPLEIIADQKAPRLITDIDEKIKLFEKLAIELCCCLRFDQQLAKVTKEQFADIILGKCSNIKCIVVGYNYTFGYQGQGNGYYLQQKLSGKVAVKIIPPVIIDQKVVSSSLIRQLISEGDITRACRFLGYLPFVRGRVVHGLARGREMGFPTINIEPTCKYVLPARGVYAVMAQFDNTIKSAVANIGVKPTFFSPKGEAEQIIEVHIIDFCGDLYDKQVKISFVQFLRKEKKFNSIQELKQQIFLDIEQAKDVIEKM